MRQAERVADLVREDMERPPQEQQVVSRAGRVSEEARIEAGKADDSDPVAERRLAEDRVPVRCGVEIGRRDPDTALGVLRDVA